VKEPLPLFSVGLLSLSLILYHVGQFILFRTEAILFQHWYPSKNELIVEEVIEKYKSKHFFKCFLSL
jgi:hypothetical protein